MLKTLNERKIHDLMTLFTPAELQSILQPFCNGSFPYISFTGVTVDSRLVAPGDLFVALGGQQQDGHHFVKNALQKGAAGALVAYLPQDVPREKVIEVSDVYQALKALSAASRQRSQAPIAAVTGSVGKTTVKEGLSFVLSRQQSTVKSPKSYNNDLGVALSLVHLRPEDQFGVFEIGMNQVGEIAPLAAAIGPHVAIITAIGPVHIEYLKTIEAIVLEKSMIFSGVCKDQPIPGGAAIIPRDSAFYDLLKEHAQKYGIQNIVSFGEHPHSYVRLKQVVPGPNGQVITALMNDKEIRYTLRLSGLHNAMNSLAILAACSIMGADVDKATCDLENFLPVSGRGTLHTVPYKGGHLVVMDESYNANVLSMKAALTNLAQFPNQGGKKIAVLGDMKELGPYSEEHHQHIGGFLVDLKIDKVAVCGQAMETAYNQLLPQQKIGKAPSSQDLLGVLKDTVQAGDVLMVKGSFSMNMNKIITYFTENI